MLSGATVVAAGGLDDLGNRAVTVAGYTLHLNTVLSAVVAGIVVIALGLFAARRASATRPTKAQLAWESVIAAAERQLSTRAGAVNARLVPLAVVLFVFILVATLLEVIPSGHPDKTLPAPTGDLNMTAALGILVVIVAHAAGIRQRGLRGYFRHYLHPSPWLLPLRLLEELVKPVTLALRLFGNIFAGSVMVLLIFEVIPPVANAVPLAAWKLFGVFAAVMQAFVFSLLTVLYVQTATGAYDEPAAAPDPLTTPNPRSSEL